MSLYDHFRPEERPFIDQVLTWKENTEIRHQDKMTDFLDPRQQDIVRSLIGGRTMFRLEFGEELKA